MAGHSKWANIKYKKEKSDKQKGKIFSRIAKEIISAVKTGGSDPKANSRLKLAIQQAKSANMPSENIERNIKKASSQDQTDFFSITYEFYGYAGVGLIVEAMTDNKNRLSSDMRIATNKKGGTIASPGSVTFNFERKGLLQVDKALVEEQVFVAAIDAGAENFEVAEQYMVLTDPQEVVTVKEKLEAANIPILEMSLEWIPKNLVATDEEAKTANFELIKYLEDLDDVTSVYHNMDL